ncbi:MAG: GTP-binding protein [Candidatus Asgardarchaeia archaeon]
MKTIKVYIAGPTSAGKTTLVHTLDKNAKSIEHYYEDGTSTTIGFDLGKVYWNHKTNEILYDIDETSADDSIYKIILMGTPGQPRFAPVRLALSKGSDGVLFVIDSTNLGQVGLIIALYEELKMYFGPDFPMVVLANKQDLENAAKAEDVKKLLKIDSVKVIETSAITGQNLIKGLLELLNIIYERKKDTIIEEKQILAH